MGPRNAVLGVRRAEAEDGRREEGEEEGRRKEGRGALSLQNEDPTPQDGGETIILAKNTTICKCEYREAGETKEGVTPYGATNRVRDVQKWTCGGPRRRMRTLPLGPSVELPVGPRNAVLGVPKWTCGGPR